MLRSSHILRSAERTLSKALPLFVVNASIPPALLLLLSRVGSEVVYAATWLLTAYFAACALSIALLLASRSALSERSIESAQRLLLITGVLGIFTGLVVGGLLTLRARSIALKAVEAKSVKKHSAGGAS